MKLQFYKKGLPIKTIHRLILLAIVFLASTAFFEIILNVTEDVSEVEMSEPTLPTIDISFLGEHSTTLHGYTTEMDPSYMRDAIIPLDEDRNIDMIVYCPDYDVDSFTYEIRSLDTLRKISSNSPTFNKIGDYIHVSVQAENLIDANEEYLLVITLGSGDTNIYYYTRIMQPDGCYEQELVDFVYNFHDVALSDDPSELATYIEPSSSADNETLYHVDINSSLSQINYGTFDGEQVGDTYITISDISSNSISMTLSYEMTRGSGKSTEYYSCSENFRVRYTSDRIYLLAYDRTMEQILTSRTIDISNNTLNIGITDEDVQYLSNETGTIVAFVQNGSLYEYDQNNRQLYTVFSFITDDYTDLRAIYDQHKILILNIDESGTMDFVVYGYMNAGSHEGGCGINLFHYDAITGLSTEQVYIDSTKSYQILNASFSDLIYESADNDFYIIVSGTLVYMQLNDLTTTELMTGLDSSQYAVSGSGRYMAWMDNSLVSDSIHILDLETGDSYDISAGSNELLKPLAFMDDDLVYGVVKNSDVISDGAGSTIYPMYELRISDISGTSEQVLMNYSKTGYYVTDITIDSYTIYLNRVTIDENNTVLEADLDTIKNSAGEQNKAVPISTTVDSVKEKTVVLTMAEFAEGETLGKVNYSNTKLVLSGGTRDVSVTTTSPSTEYFVYVGNEVSLATDNLISAITEADENMGIVLDNEQRYIWKRGKKSYTSAFSNISVGSSDNEDTSGIAKALSAMLVHEGENIQVHSLLESGETPISILSRSLKDYTILDLTGADLSEVLYYVSIGNPVYAKTGEDTAVLIIGYDSTSITIFDPETGSNSKMSQSEASTYFESCGNVFVSYLTE